jgi:hypothetical protein
MARGPIARALPADEFDVHGLNAEMRWEVMRGQGYVVPNASFFVRNHTSTPLIDAETWSLRVFGTGLRGPVTAGQAVRFSYQDLLDLPARTVMASIECAGNGRRFFASQQGRAVPGTPWRLGAIGVAAWRGVPLSVILDRSGIAPRHRPASRERGCLAAVGVPVAHPRPGFVHPAGQGHRHRRHHPAGHRGLQHARLPVRRHRQAPGHRGLARR